LYPTFRDLIPACPFRSAARAAIHVAVLENPEIVKFLAETRFLSFRLPGRYKALQHLFFYHFSRSSSRKNAAFAFLLYLELAFSRRQSDRGYSIKGIFSGLRGPCIGFP
jgi:hypothetical protein